MAERVIDKYQFKIIKQEIRAMSMNVLLARFLSKMDIYLETLPQRSSQQENPCSKLTV